MFAHTLKLSRPPLVLMAVVALGVASVGYLTFPAAQNSAAPFDQRCESWDNAASAAIAGLVRERDEATERQLGDALFRLRRARKNCRIGWIALARSDYKALLDGRYGRRL
jgi:hypothetical protein